MKKTALIIIALLLAVKITSQESREADLLKAMHSISSHDLLEYVKIQCDDRYAGRLTGTPEYQECAKWLAGEFEKMGLEPAGDNGTWFQWFRIPYTLVLPDCGLTLHVPVNKGVVPKNYRYITEYMPGSTSGNGEVTGEVVYAGYGITAPEIGYDDYAGVDVKGKIVLIEREAPVDPGAGAEKFNPWYGHSFHQSKLANAVKHGAIGMIYNYGPIANPNNDYIENFVYVHAGDTVVRDIFAGTGMNHAEVVSKIRSKVRPLTFNTGKSVTIRMSTRHFPDGRGSNVVGMLRGSGESKETIIIGAHLDHMGRCYEIIPGANDNASAVAVMMGVARALSGSGITLKRNVLFVAFGAEEQALIGSKTYLEKPVFPLEESVLINMDGVGIGHSIGANAGKNYPLMWSFIEAANNDYIHRPLTTNHFPNLGRPRLDASRFMTAGVPSLSFYTYGTTNFYHVPYDNIEIIRPEIMEDLCRILLVSVVRMANSPEPLRK